MCHDIFPWLGNLVVFLFDILVAWIVLRGGRGRLRRAFSMLEMCASLMVGLCSLCLFMVMMVKPDMSMDDMFQYAAPIYILLLGTIVLYVYVVLYRREIYLCFKTSERVLMIFFDLYIFVLFCFVIMETEDAGKINMGEGFKYLFVITLAVFYMVFLGVLIKNRLTEYYKQGQAYQQEWMEKELAHFTEYKRTEEETRQFRHDVINNLTCVEALLQDGRAQEAKQYVGELLGQVKELSPKVVTGDEMLDCIISTKWEVMEQAGIKFTIDGVLDRGLSWQPIDICTVFANALDNAIEACMQVETARSISLSCKHTKNFYYIEMRNSMCQDLDLRALEGTKFTTKKHKELHGYGMENIRRTLNHYDCQMKIEKEDGMFVLKMVIPG